MLSPGPPSRVSSPGPPVDEVVAIAADEDVVAGAAVERQGDQARLEAARGDGVVAPEGVDGQSVQLGIG